MNSEIYHKVLMEFGKNIKEIAKDLDLSVHDTLLLMNEYRVNDMLRDDALRKVLEAQ